MKKRGMLIILFMLMALVVCLPVRAEASGYKWKSVGNGNYQLYKDGKLVRNQWVKSRHANASGYMDRNKWVPRTVQGKTTTYFVRDDGKAVLNFKAGWQKIGKKYYYYTASGVMVKNKWITIGKKDKYYVGSNGARATGLVKFNDGYRYFASDGKSQTGWVKIKGKYYYFQPDSRLALTNGFHKVGKKTYCFDANGVLQTGWVEKDGKWYYFKKYMGVNRWFTLNSKKYYLTASGARAEGLVTIGGKMYYFDPSTGVLQVDKAILADDGKEYLADKNGVCTVITHTPVQAPSADMLFFLVFESGSEAYRQTGGDNGCACGAYQFDYRYSLLEFVQWAYKQDPIVCSQFKKFAKCTSGASLKSNTKFYKAWQAIYDAHPKEFSAMQDQFAKENYYDPAEAALAKAGIDLSGRPDVVKGAVYSYSIQSGSLEAVNAVKKCKPTDEMSNEVLLKRLYKLRIKAHPAYQERYVAEYKMALTRLP